MTARRRAAIGEAASAAIILAATAAASVIILGVFTDSVQVTTDDLRSRMDILRDQAVERMDVASTSWDGGPGNPGNYTFLVSNYGDYGTQMPFALYDEDGVEKTDANVVYRFLNGSQIVECTPSANCSLYDRTLAAKSVIRVTIGSWPGNAEGADPLIIMTGTGRAVWVGDR